MPHEFVYVDQALNTLKKVEQYISAGMETTIDVALDLVEHSGENEGVTQERIPKLEAIMLEYAEMERDLTQFQETVKVIKDEVLSLPRDSEWPELVTMLDSRLEDMKTTNQNGHLEKHEKFLELRQKIWDVLHTDGESRPVDSLELGDDEDFAMTQTEVNYKCPYTGREMVNPMRNKLCKHNYDEQAVKEMFKTKNSVKCPVTGCVNRNKPFTVKDLEENRELKKMIEVKNRQTKRVR